MPITPDEQVKKIDNEINQLKARKQAIVNREKQKQKKERAKRLIKYGKLVEDFLNCEGILPNHLEEHLMLISRLIKNGALAEKYLNCDGMPSDKFEELLKVVISKLKNMS